jgi:hypothetical protein
VADESKQTKADEPKQQQAAAAQKQQKTVTVERLIANAEDYLGVGNFVAAGAFHGTDEQEEMTVDEAKQRVETWLNTPIEETSGQEGGA